ncbi:aconitate hydratase [Dipsacomyces acuminosporus]|nr:aconitate hydratase [Dipsacomyces acuminosporus]
MTPISASNNSVVDKPKKKAEGEVFTKDVDINLSANRQTLAKSATQKLIMEQTGAEVSTKGRYFADPSNATPEDPALHLRVEAPAQEILDQAVAMIESMKNEAPSQQSAAAPNERQGQGQGQRQDQFSDPATSSNSGHGGQRYGPSSHSYQLHEKVYVEIESERGFNVRAKIIGTGGENMKYIQSTTGCRVQVRGRGSGFIEGTSGAEAFEPMHLFVSAYNEDVLKQAKDLCRSLIDTIHSQYQEFKEGGGSSRRHSHYGHRDNKGYYDHQASHHSYQQQYQQQQSLPYGDQLQYAEPSHAQDQPANSDGGASYEDYANYYAQYYQYYGTYPDYSSYYGQADPNASGYQQYAQDQQQQQQQQQPANDYTSDPASGSSIQASSESQQQQQQQQPSPPPPPADGYHNVPPPPSYSKGSKVNKH